MIGNNTRTWVGGTAVLTLLAVLVTWFLLISPQRAQAAELRQQTLDIRSSNDLLVSQTAQLEQQFSHLPELQDELADLRASVPATLGLSDLTRQLAATAAATGVTLTSIAPATPALDTSTGSGGAAAATSGAATATVPATTDAATTDTTTTETTTASAAAATAVASGAVEMPLTLEVVGTPDAVTAFLESVQTSARAFLVTGFGVQAEDAAEAAAGRPATVAGDTTLNIAGSVFTLPDDTATDTATTTATTGAAAAATPTPAP